MIHYIWVAIFWQVLETKYESQKINLGLLDYEGPGNQNLYLDFLEFRFEKVDFFCAIFGAVDPYMIRSLFKLPNICIS